MKELLVIINGEVIKLPHKHNQIIGDAIRAAFEKSHQQVGESNIWWVHDRYGDDLDNSGKVEYLEHIYVTLGA